MTACVTPKHVGEANIPRENQKKGKPGTGSEFNNWRHWLGCGQGVGDFASYSQKPVTPPKANTKNKYNKKQANYPLEDYKQASSYACHIRACKDAQHEMLRSMCGQTPGPILPPRNFTLTFPLRKGKCTKTANYSNLRTSKKQNDFNSGLWSWMYHVRL